MTWGIIPAAGLGSRIRPLAFSKELLPVGARLDRGWERPRAVSEYLVERLIIAGADRLCFVISAEKADIMTYFGSSVNGVPVCYVLQERPQGLCDAIFSALPFLGGQESAIVGLPDTVWFPADGLRTLPGDGLSFLLFPVDEPHLFDAVVMDAAGAVTGIEVKSARPSTIWIWGAFKIPAGELRALHVLWHRRGRQDQFWGSLVNAYIDEGGRVSARKAGTAYADVGTFCGYRNAIRVVQEMSPTELVWLPPEEHHEQA